MHELLSIDQISKIYYDRLLMIQILVVVQLYKVSGEASSSSQVECWMRDAKFCTEAHDMNVGLPISHIRPRSTVNVATPNVHWENSLAFLACTHQQITQYLLTIESS